MPSQPASQKPVAERLQVKGARTLAVLRAPAAIDAAIAAIGQRREVEAADIVLLFVHHRADMDLHLGPTLAALKSTAIFWIVYPKLTSKLAGDLHRDIIHTLAPGHGLDTVSAISIDADWSALRLKRV